jgi:hypothetical protein
VFAIATLTWWSHRKLRLGGLSQLEAKTSYEGFDTRQFRDGRGTLIYMWAIDLTNVGGRMATCRGIIPKLGQLPFAVAMRDGQSSDERLQTTLYVLTRPIFEALSRDPAVLDRETPKVWEELRTLNISVGPGEVKTLYLVCKIADPESPIDGVLFNFEVALSPGRSLALSKAVMVARRSASAVSP